MSKPSLHEIAAMPFPDSLKAMREHYDACWGKRTEIENAWEVRVEFSYRLTATEVIECHAATEKDAIRLAKDIIEDRHAFDDVEIEDASIASRPQ